MLHQSLPGESRGGIRSIESADGCKQDLNLGPFLIEVAEAGGTVGEIVEIMKKVYGEWEESFGI